VNHNTGRPLVSFMTLSITHEGYHDSGFDNMSFVPRAMTIAVVCGVSLFETVDAPARAVLPTRASMETRVHIPVLRVRVAREPNASEPTVSESPTKRRVPWPLAPMSCGVRMAEARSGSATRVSRAKAVAMDATA